MTSLHVVGIVIGITYGLLSVPYILIMAVAQFCSAQVLRSCICPIFLELIFSIYMLLASIGLVIGAYEENFLLLLPWLSAAFIGLPLFIKNGIALVDKWHYLAVIICVITLVFYLWSAYSVIALLIDILRKSKLSS